MCSTTFSREPATYPTKGLMPAPCSNADYEKDEAEFHPVRMSWVVITDRKGIQRLRMRWQTK